MHNLKLLASVVSRNMFLLMDHFFHWSCVEDEAENMNGIPGYDPLGGEKPLLLQNVAACTDLQQLKEKHVVELYCMLYQVFHFSERSKLRLYMLLINFNLLELRVSKLFFSSLRLGES